MTYHYDLHIHSVLSPCADCLMTPNNIFNMAMLKKLDIIAVTDHNTMKQLPVCHELSKSYDMLFVPGVEITVSEGFDILVYFKTLKDALAVDQCIQKGIKPIPIDETFYGKQEIMNIYDETMRHYPYVLIEPLTLSIKDIKTIIAPYETICVLPHANRLQKSMMKYIKNMSFDAVEYTSLPSFETYLSVYNSDAHQITELLESTEKNAIELSSLTMDAFFSYFKK